jgi:hypothetical protein
MGERQHYFQGLKFKKTYGQEGQKFIPDRFDPREFMIMSTDFNRTIMSAYSELLGYHAPGSIQQLSKDQALYSKPPYDLNGNLSNNSVNEYRSKNY